MKKKWWKKCSFFLRFTTRRWFPALRNKILEGNVCKYFHRYEFLLCRFGLFFDTWIFSLGAFLKPQIAWCKIVNSIYCPVWGIYWNLSNLSNISLKKKKNEKKNKKTDVHMNEISEMNWNLQLFFECWNCWDQVLFYCIKLDQARHF